MRSSGHADRAPVLDRLLVRSQAEALVAAEDRDPDVVEVEPEAVLLRRGEVEREHDRLLLEVVAHREVAEHLEEGEMPERRADDLDVNRAERLLARGEPARRRLLLAAEVGLEGLHPGGSEQHRRVVGARDERRRRNAQMPVPLEERQKPLPDLGSLHRGWSLGGALSSRVADSARTRPKSRAARCKPRCRGHLHAISVQFRANSPDSMELHPQRCALHVHARETAGNRPTMPM